MEDGCDTLEVVCFLGSALGNMFLWSKIFQGGLDRYRTGRELLCTVH